uniref:Serine-threonine/tyrosine-protein kinase catalytic domain-containing protein n=1 Tax=Knipowitschia caucasica TaxID=637954 RepID=A0AAV2JCS2_KNICA
MVAASENDTTPRWLIYEVMHSCWSPVPKCRPSFSDLVSQLQTLLSSLESSPQTPPAPLLYVNLPEGEGALQEGEGAGLLKEGAEFQQTWSQSHDWMSVSGAALAIGGDYRYIMSPCAEDDHDDEDAVINV